VRKDSYDGVMTDQPTHPNTGKPTVMFLHAFPLAAAMWAGQIAAVAAAGYPTLAPDFPGFGGQIEQPQDLPSLDAYVTWLLPQLPAEPVVVVGLSMGGYIAMRLAEQAPQHIKALVLADTRAGADNAVMRAGRAAFAEQVELEHQKPGGVAPWLAAAMLPVLLSKNASPELQSRLREMMQVHHLALAQAQRAMAARPDSFAALASLQVPALCIVGSLDALTPPAGAEAMAAVMTNARVMVLEGAGHISNLEDEAGFNEALLAFLAEL
jgi:3-oxoadipate enol-lactonase